jgi:hypothetical protein
MFQFHIQDYHPQAVKLLHLIKYVLASCPVKTVHNYLHFHLRKANAFLVGLPLLSFIAPFTPDILAQKLALRFAALEPLFTLPVTGAFKLAPVFLLKYRLPAAFKPPEGD